LILNNFNQIIEDDFFTTLINLKHLELPSITKDINIYDIDSLTSFSKYYTLKYPTNIKYDETKKKINTIEFNNNIIKYNFDLIPEETEAAASASASGGYYDQYTKYKSRYLLLKNL